MTNPPIHAQVDVRQPNAIKTALGKALAAAYTQTKKDPELLIVLLPMQDRQMYEEIKRSSV